MTVPVSKREQDNRKAEAAGKLDRQRREVGRFPDRNDCSVVALGVALDMSYREAHNLMAACGRKPYRGVHTSVMRRALTALSIPTTPVLAARTEYQHSSSGYDRAVRRRRRRTIGAISLAQFVKQFKAGRYLVRVSGHMLAVIDGVIHDHTYSPKRRVVEAWRVVPVTQYALATGTTAPAVVNPVAAT